MTKKKRAVEPALGDFLLVHVPFDHWFLRQVYLSEGGERGARLIDQNQSLEKLSKIGRRQAKGAKGRLLQLIKSEIKGTKEINTWEVLDDFVS